MEANEPKQIGSCTLYHGDCFDIIPKLKITSDLILSDPPYAMTACDWDVQIPLAHFWHLIAEKARPAANFVLFGCGKFSVDMINTKYNWYRYDLVWVKNNKVGFLNANKQPMRSHEQILVFGRPGEGSNRTYNAVKSEGGHVGFVRRHTKDGVYPGQSYTSFSDGRCHPDSVLHFGHDRGSGQQGGNYHPTQKPLALMEFLIKSYSNAGDIVIDPFMGSGTTGLACAKTGRKFIGIEKEKKYFETAAERMRKEL